MIYEENTDGINVFPILHRHVTPRFNVFLPTEQHQSLASAELIVDTDTIYSQLQWWIARRFGSLSSLHFISVTDVGSSPPPFCRPPPGTTGQRDNIVLGSNLRYTTGIIHLIWRSELTLASDVSPLGVLLKIVGNSLPSRIQRTAVTCHFPASFAQYPLHTSPSVPWSTWRVIFNRIKSLLLLPCDTLIPNGFTLTVHFGLFKPP